MSIKAFVFDAYGTLYDVQSVAHAVTAAFPAHSDTITQVWRLKQLEYSWLRSLMGRYEDFRQVTRESLDYTLAALGLTADEALLVRLIDAYDNLTPYPEAEQALTTLAEYRRAFGFNVVRIERVTPAALRAELTGGTPIGPAAMFRALRSQIEALGLPAHSVVDSLLALPELVK